MKGWHDNGDGRWWWWYASDHHDSLMMPVTNVVPADSPLIEPHVVPAVTPAKTGLLLTGPGADIVYILLLAPLTHPALCQTSGLFVAPSGIMKSQAMTFYQLKS